MARNAKQSYREHPDWGKSPLAIYGLAGKRKFMDIYGGEGEWAVHNFKKAVLKHPDIVLSRHPVYGVAETARLVKAIKCLKLGPQVILDDANGQSVSGIAASSLVRRIAVAFLQDKSPGRRLLVGYTYGESIGGFGGGHDLVILWKNGLKIADANRSEFDGELLDYDRYSPECFAKRLKFQLTYIKSDWNQECEDEPGPTEMVGTLTRDTADGQVIVDAEGDFALDEGGGTVRVFP